MPGSPYPQPSCVRKKKSYWKKFKAILHPWKKQIVEAQLILKLSCMSVRSLFYTYNHSHMPKRLKIAMMLYVEDKEINTISVN
jgi:hypothetical protein